MISLGRVAFNLATRIVFAVGEGASTVARHPIRSTVMAATILGPAAACSSADITESGNGAFTKQLLEGLDLGDQTVTVTTEAASMKTVTLTIPINIGKGYSVGLEDLKLLLRLSTDFDGFPVFLTGWEMDIDGDTYQQPNDFAEQQIDGGGEAIIDLPEELNWSGVMQPTEVRAKLRLDTTLAQKGMDYEFPVHAILQGTER